MLKQYSIEEILLNDKDFPIEPALYNITTPNVIYLQPTKNNFIRKGLLCTDGLNHKKYLKRFRVLYIPEYIFTNYNYVKLEDEQFVLPSEKFLSGYPVLAYSYIILPMNVKDRIFFYEKYYTK